MKIRIFKKLDGGVIYNYPNSSKYPNPEDCPIPESLKDLPYVIMEHSEAPVSDSTTGDYHEMIYFDGNDLKQDKEWKVMLMPPFLIKEKQLERLNDKIDVELEKPDPSPIEIARLTRAKEKLATATDQTLYAQALANIEEDNIDKPVIKAKLEEKLK